MGCLLDLLGARHCCGAKDTAMSLVLIPVGETGSNGEKEIMSYCQLLIDPGHRPERLGHCREGGPDPAPQPAPAQQGWGPGGTPLPSGGLCRGWDVWDGALTSPHSSSPGSSGPCFRLSMG